MRRRYRHWWQWPLAPLFWLGDLLLWPVYFLLSTVTNLSWTVRSRLRRGGASFWLGTLLWLPLWPFVELGRFLAWMGGWLLQWPHMLNFRFLLQGLPALLVALGVTVLFAYPAKTDQDVYLRAAINANESEDYEAALVYYKSLLSISPEKEAFRFGLALTYEKLGDYNRARALMEALAPRDRAGYPPAHHWVAIQLLSGPRDAKTIQNAQIHLMRVVEANDNAYEAHATLGKLYLANGDPRNAEVHLTKAAPKMPELWLALARVHVLQGKRETALQEVQRVLSEFEPVEKKRLDAVEARLYCAEALLFLERFSDAAALLQKGLAINSAEHRYGALLSRVNYIWADRLKATSAGGNVQQQYTLLQRAYLADPSNVLVLRRIVTGLSSAETVEANAMSTMVQELANMHPESAMLRFFIAHDMTVRGQQNLVDSELAQARKLAEVDSKAPPQIAELSRFLLDRASTTDVPQPELAFRLVDLGLRCWPDQPDLRHARGYFRARAQRWPEALMDLEAVLAQGHRDRRLHWTLADVYEHLGMSKQAAEHRQQFYGAISVNQPGGRESP